MALILILMTAATVTWVLLACGVNRTGVATVSLLAVAGISGLFFRQGDFATHAFVIPWWAMAGVFAILYLGTAGAVVATRSFLKRKSKKLKQDRN